MTEKIKQRFNERYQGKPVDCGEFKICKVFPIKFNIEAFDFVGFGRVSFMTGSALFGLMKMETVMIAPKYIDHPIASCDTIEVVGNLTGIFELYDTLLSKESFDEKPFEEKNKKYESLPKYEQKPAWSDDIRLKCSFAKKVKKDETKLNDYLNEYIDCLFASFEKAPICDPEQKNAKNSEYVEALISNGGVATDKFIKKFGIEKTGELFRKILWGTK